MNRVRAFFVEEATECLEEIESELERANPDTERLYGAMRRLRGSAQVARFGALADDALALEDELRQVVHGEMTWDDALDERLAGGTESLTRAVEAVREGRTAQDEREPGETEPDEGTPADGARDDEEPPVHEGPLLTHAPDEVVPAESLEYRGAAALDRAESIRGPLREALAEAGPVELLLDELFDLIRLGRK